jgi:hypothetical protein
MLVACRLTGRHIIALEPDSDIFKGVLEAIMDLKISPSSSNIKRAPLLAINDDDVPAVKVKRPRFCK